MTSVLFAEDVSDQDYINQLFYRRNKLELVVKTRFRKEKRTYSQTDIDTTTYTWEAYTQTYGTVSTTGFSRTEDVEIEDWYIYKGKIREISDAEFLELIGDRARLERVLQQENQKGKMRFIGNTAIGAGIVSSIVGAALSAGETAITAGALTTVAGFFISAFNLSPHHYIQPDYAQEKIDEYNINLKRKLNLPLGFE
jgi:hypothetical protein